MRECNIVNFLHQMGHFRIWFSAADIYFKMKFESKILWFDPLDAQTVRTSLSLLVLEFFSVPPGADTVIIQSTGVISGWAWTSVRLNPNMKTTSIWIEVYIYFQCHQVVAHISASLKSREFYSWNICPRKHPKCFFSRLKKTRPHFLSSVSLLKDMSHVKAFLGHTPFD